jgi:hypothetical protein
MKASERITMMKEEDFIRMCKDAYLHMDESILRNVFESVQQDEDFGIEDPSLSQEMSYQEFQEVSTADDH